MSTIALAPPDGVTLDAWQRLALPDGRCWAIDERNAQGEVIGTAYRLPDGGKDFKPGGKRGLILPWPLDAYAGTSRAKPLFICEGASDTAALMGLGLDAVGIPMAGHCASELADLLGRDRHAVIVKDVDEAGARSAEKLAAALLPRCASVRIIAPPEGAKDARDAVIAGADRAAFLAQAAAAEPRPRPEPEPTADMELVPVSAAWLIKRYPALRPAIIRGVLREGEVMNLVAGPKVGKTYLAHDLAIAVAAEREWLGMPVTGGNVLIFDGELHGDTISERLRMAVQAFDVDAEQLGNRLMFYTVRGMGVTIERLSALVERAPVRPSVIIVDAMYRFLPDHVEENSNEDMTRVYNTIDGLAASTGAAVVLVHHTSKGSQADRAVTDVGSGAGAQSRAADVHMVLRAHEVEDAVVVDLAVRSHPRVAPYVLRWTNPGWRLDTDGLDPSQLWRPQKRAPKANASAEQAKCRIHSVEDFARVAVGPSPTIRDEVIARATAEGLSKTEAESMLNRALDARLAHRWIFGPCAPHRFASLPQHAPLREGQGGDGAEAPAPGASGSGGYGGARTPPPPPLGTLGPTSANPTDAA